MASSHIQKAKNDILQFTIVSKAKDILFANHQSQS